METKDEENILILTMDNNCPFMNHWGLEMRASDLTL